MESVVFKNDGGIIKLKLNKGAPSKKEIHGVVRRYLLNKERYFIYNENIKYPGISIKVISYIKNGYQNIVITSNDDKILKEINNSLLITNNYMIYPNIELKTPIRLDKNGLIDEDLTTNQIMDLYKDEYFKYAYNNCVNITLGIEYNIIYNFIIDAFRRVYSSSNIEYGI